MRHEKPTSVMFQTILASLFATAAQAATPVTLSYVPTDQWSTGYCAAVANTVSYTHLTLPTKA